MTTAHSLAGNFRPNASASTKIQRKWKLKSLQKGGLDDSLFAQALTFGLARRKIYKVVCTAYVQNAFGRQFLCPSVNPQPQQQQQQQPQPLSSVAT